MDEVQALLVTSLASGSLLPMLRRSNAAHQQLGRGTDCCVGMLKSHVSESVGFFLLCKR